MSNEQEMSKKSVVRDELTRLNEALESINGQLGKITACNVINTSLVRAETCESNEPAVRSILDDIDSLVFDAHAFVNQIMEQVHVIAARL